MHLKTTICGISVPSYSLMVLLGLAAVSLAGFAVCRRRGLSVKKALLIGLAAGAAALAGARLFSGIGGLSFYGGLLPGLLAAYAAGRILLPPGERKEYTNALSFTIPMLHAFWKLGCFMAGCCYGIPYSGPGAVMFPAGAKAPAGIFLFPVQPVEAAASALIAVILYLRGRQERKMQMPIAEYLLMYGIVRFAAEFFRDHGTPQASGAGLSEAQIISLVCAAAAAAVLLMHRQHSQQQC